jgi:hypothetical protein
MSRMTPETVQAHVNSLITGVAELAAFGPVVSYSNFLDYDAQLSAKNTQLKATGVFIEVSEPEITASDDRSTRGQLADAEFDVYYAESTKVSHSPQNLALRQSVIAAVTRQVDSYTERARFLRSETIAEQGTVVRQLTFSIRIVLT